MKPPIDRDLPRSNRSWAEMPPDLVMRGRLRENLRLEEVPVRRQKRARVKASPPQSRRKKKRVRTKAPARPTLDTRMIDWARAWPRRVKHGVAAGVLLLLAVMLTIGLFTHDQHHLLALLGSAFYGLFGWSAFPLAFGLIVLAVANLAEAAARISIIRLAVVIQVALLWCLFLLESRLLFGGNTGQFFGMLLAAPIASLPALVQQIGVIVGIAILLLLLFRISFGQVLWSIVWLFRSLYSLARWLFSRLTLAIKQVHTSHKATMQVRSRPVEGEADPLLAMADDEEEADSAPSFNVLPTQDDAIPESDRFVPENAPQAPLLPLKTGTQEGAKTANTNVALPTGKTAAAGRYVLPAINLLNSVVEQRQRNQEAMIEALARKMEHTLHSLRIAAEVRRSDISVGPTVIRIGIRPLETTKKDSRGHVVLDEDGSPQMVRTRVNRIMALQDDLALALEAKSIRMEAPVPGQPYVGVEIPNKQGRLVTLREILVSKEYEESRRKSRLTIALGRDVTGQAFVGDLARFPHVLIAGATGSGKSVCVNSIIACILMQATPEDVRFLMIDPKMVELTGFNGIPHLLAPVVTDVEHVIGALQRGVSEMERRYRLFSKLGVRNLDAYRKLRAQRPDLEVLPNIVIIIDELADLMMAAPDEVEQLICRLAQLARATGIHLVVATQRPSVDVITGLIKANIPTRISFMVSSAVDSRTIIDMGGAERLLGRGDMLYLPVDAGKPERIQGTFLADEELERIVHHWRQIPANSGPSWELAPGNTSHVPEGEPEKNGK